MPPIPHGLEAVDAWARSDGPFFCSLVLQMFSVEQGQTREHHNNQTEGSYPDVFENPFDHEPHLGKTSLSLIRICPHLCFEARSRVFD